MKKSISNAVCLLAGLLSGCSSMTPEKSVEVITVGTYNVRCPSDKQPPFDWQTRIPLIREVIRRTGVDILGVQEPVDFQLQAILKDSVFKSIGVARNDFKSQGEYSCILYNANRFDVLESGTFGLSETPDVPGVKSWMSGCPRIATWGVFRDRQDGRKFIMYNTHLDNRSELARINGIRLIVEHAQQKQKLGMPMILTGDFNASPDSETIKTACSLLRDSAAVSETGHKGEVDSFHKWGTIPQRKHLDYIFVSPEVRVLKHWTEDGRVDGQYSSDHDPVLAEIAFVESPSPQDGKK